MHLGPGTVTQYDTMPRTFRSVDHEAALDLTVRLGDCLPPNHLVRFVADTVAQLDLSAVYARSSKQGGTPYAPELLLGIIFFGYSTGIFSSRKLERATYETIPFRFLAGNLHPDHDTLADFRKNFLPELEELFVQILLLAQAAGLLQVGNVSLDGTKIHADASKSHAVSHKRLLELEVRLRAEVQELFALSEAADAATVPPGLSLPEELALRQLRLTRLAEAKVVLEARAAARFAAEQADYEAKQAEREEKTERTGRPPRGKPPTPPTPGPRDGDQYNFTDPESRIMKNSQNAGFDQHYNAQVAVEQASRLIVGLSLSNHPNDQAEVAPTLDSLPAALGAPQAAALDSGYFSAQNLALLAERGIDAYIATGRDAHHRSWQERFAGEPKPPAADASPKVKMAYLLLTAVGQAIYRLRKCTVEPVIGIIKEVLGFRQFSLRGEVAARGEWVLVCLAYNLKRLHTLTTG